LNSELEIEPLLEVYIDQVVAAPGTVQGERASENVNAVEPGDVAGLRDKMLDDLLEICQFVCRLNHKVSSIIALSCLLAQPPSAHGQVLSNPRRRELDHGSADDEHCAGG
jgi:hypothetical protein